MAETVKTDTYAWVASALQPLIMGLLLSGLGVFKREGPFMVADVCAGVRLMAKTMSDPLELFIERSSAHGADLVVDVTAVSMSDAVRLVSPQVFWELWTELDGSFSNRSRQLAFSSEEDGGLVVARVEADRLVDTLVVHGQDDVKSVARWLGGGEH